VLEDSNEYSFLGGAIKDLLGAYKLDNKLLEREAVKAWDKVAGSLITKYTSKVFIKGGVLFVKIDSSVIKNEVSYEKSHIIKEINKICGTEVVKEIKLI